MAKETNNTNIDYLLRYFNNKETAEEKAIVYNKVALILWVQFGIQSAELQLLCAYCTLEYIKKYMEDNKNGKKIRNKKDRGSSGHKPR